MLILSKDIFAAHFLKIFYIYKYLWIQRMFIKYYIWKIPIFTLWNIQYAHSNFSGFNTQPKTECLRRFCIVNKIKTKMLTYVEKLCEVSRVLPNEEKMWIFPILNSVEFLFLFMCMKFSRNKQTIYQWRYVGFFSPFYRSGLHFIDSYVCFNFKKHKKNDGGNNLGQTVDLL